MSPTGSNDSQDMYLFQKANDLKVSFQPMHPLKIKCLIERLGFQKTETKRRAKLEELSHCDWHHATMAYIVMVQDLKKLWTFSFCLEGAASKCG